MMAAELESVRLAARDRLGLGEPDAIDAGLLSDCNIEDLLTDEVIYLRGKKKSQ